MSVPFFDDQTLLLGNDTAKELYENVRELPIVDYHCHLDPEMIGRDAAFSNLGQLWLSGDHYKWRAMRLCGVDEHFITGHADDYEKFLAYAKILPMLCGNPLYYWTHMELKQVFSIDEPLSEANAEDVFREASKQLSSMTARTFLKRFRVEYVATTDDPIDDLRYHGTYETTTVAPTFRPERALKLEEEYLNLLSECSGCDTSTLDGFCAALTARLDYFCSKGCRISDHSFGTFPEVIADRETAKALYARRSQLTESEYDALLGHLFARLLAEYQKRSIVTQVHFGVSRNVNPSAFALLGADRGFDVIGTPPDPQAVVKYVASIANEDRPEMLLYCLNDSQLPALNCLTGAFPGVHVGAAWWFNDTVHGIRRALRTAAEYSVLGTFKGMLTDSRSFSSYPRFDFFRRIAADLIGDYVEHGEYEYHAAKNLMHKLCYLNAKEMIGS